MKDGPIITKTNFKVEKLSILNILQTVGKQEGRIH